MFRILYFWFQPLIVNSTDKGQFWYASCWVERAGLTFARDPFDSVFGLLLSACERYGRIAIDRLHPRSKPVFKLKSHAKLLEDVTSSINFLTNTVSIQANSSWLSAAPTIVFQSPFSMAVHYPNVHRPPPPGSRCTCSRVEIHHSVCHNRQHAFQWHSKPSLARRLHLKSMNDHNPVASSSLRYSISQTMVPSSSAACHSACAK